MDAFPILHTSRLILRKIQVEDIPALLEYANNKKISDYVLSIPYPYNEPDAVFRISYVWQGFKNKVRYVFAVIFKEREELVGEIGLHLDNNKIAQLGYWVGEPFWNKGIATEAIEAVLKFGFEKLQLEQIYAACHEENKASGKVLEKNGVHIKNVNGKVILYTINKTV
jgi:RimJ/RimL family protein N-acetyltransferase